MNRGVKVKINGDNLVLLIRVKKLLIKFIDILEIIIDND